MRKINVLLAALAAPWPAMAEGDFNVAEEVQFCMECHGETGIPSEPDFPIIWGQEYFYLYTQIRDYGAGRRENEIMTGIAAEYSRDEAKLLAAHFAEQQWPAIETATQDGDAQAAELGITGGQCSACHGKWQGDSRIPRVAGQQPGYLDKTMQDFKQEIRLNAPDKISTMKQLDDTTIEALARYLSSL